MVVLRGVVEAGVVPHLVQVVAAEVEAGPHPEVAAVVAEVEAEPHPEVVAGVVEVQHLDVIVGAVGVVGAVEVEVQALL